jgi:hypothetical protein
LIWLGTRDDKLDGAYFYVVNHIMGRGERSYSLLEFRMAPGNRQRLAVSLFCGSREKGFGECRLGKEAKIFYIG